jgi:hypothetical protein
MSLSDEIIAAPCYRSPAMPTSDMAQRTVGLQYDAMDMHPRQLLTGLILTAVAVLGAACSAPAPGDTASPAASSTPAPSADNLLSTLQTTVSVKELMHGLFDPASDFIFLGAGSEVTKDGVREWKPETDEDWEKVRLGAMVMAEGSQLLRVHRTWAPAGDVNNSEGPDAPELSPDQIEAKVKQDPVLWDAKVQALENVGREVLQIVDKKDAVGLFNAGDDLDTACEDCHLAYWYPNQLQFLDRIDRKLEELYGNQMNVKRSR